MKVALKFLVALFITLVFVTTNNAQVIGKILPKSEAETLFGKVDKSVTFSKTNLEVLLKNAPDNVMFMIKDGKLYIAIGAAKEVLYPNGYTILETDVFHVYSTRVLIALLNFMKMDIGTTISAADEVIFEMRGGVMTVSYDAYLMEFGTPCPPFCN